MATDAERTVVIDVEVEDKDFDKRIGEVNKELRKNREEIKELSKDYDNNAEQIAALELENKKLSASKRQLTKESQIEASSLNALRLQLAKQTQERNNLNTSNEAGARRFKELQESIAGLNDEISGFEQAGGDFRRNVGNYPELLDNASNSITGFGSDLLDVFKLILTNPIGLIITAITALIGVFAKSQTGIEFFRTAAAGLNIILAKLSDLVEAAGAALIDAFESPQKTLDELVDTIKDGIFRYFNEFIPNAINNVLDGFGLLGKAVKQVFEGDFSGALETAKEGTGQLLDGLTDLNPVTDLVKRAFEAAVPAIKEFSAELDVAVKAATNLEERLIANEKAQADLEVTRARSIKQLKELNLIIEDVTKSDEERLAAADEAAEIELSLLNERLRLQGELVDIIKDQNDLANSTEEDIQRRRDAEIEFFNIEAESLERSVTLQNKRNAIINAQRAKEEQERKADAARIKKEEAEKKKKEEEDRKKALEQQKFEQQILRQGTSDLRAALGEQNAIGRAAAIVDIATNAGVAISGAVKAAQNVPFPANLAAIASGIAAVIGGIGQANSFLGSSGGGGGVSGGGSIGFSIGESISATDSQIGLGISAPISQAAIQSSQTAQSFENAVTKLPAPVVSVTDINDVDSDRAVVVQDATL